MADPAVSLGCTIAVLGVSGAGKSTFINAICGEEVCRAGASAESITEDVSYIEATVDGQRVVLVDTPGFNGTNVTDENLLEWIAERLFGMADIKNLFNGIIILQPVENPRVLGTEKRMIQLLEAIIGPRNMSHVVVGFTMCDKGDNASISQSIRGRSDPKYWGKWIGMGARVVNLRKDFSQEYFKAVRLLLSKQKVTLQMQSQLRESRGRLIETSAGQVLKNRLTRIAYSHQDPAPAAIQTTDSTPSDTVPTNALQVTGDPNYQTGSQYDLSTVTPAPRSAGIVAEGDNRRLWQPGTNSRPLSTDSNIGSYQPTIHDKSSGTVPLSEYERSGRLMLQESISSEYKKEIGKPYPGRPVATQPREVERPRSWQPQNFQEEPQSINQSRIRQSTSGQSLSRILAAVGPQSRNPPKNTAPRRFYSHQLLPISKPQSSKPNYYLVDSESDNDIEDKPTPRSWQPQNFQEELQSINQSRVRQSTSGQSLNRNLVAVGPQFCNPPKNTAPRRSYSHQLLPISKPQSSRPNYYFVDSESDNDIEDKPTPKQAKARLKRLQTRTVQKQNFRWSFESVGRYIVKVATGITAVATAAQAVKGCSLM